MLKKVLGYLADIQNPTQAFFKARHGASLHEHLSDHEQEQH